MKGGLYIPPNLSFAEHFGLIDRASMKGGLYIPPNSAALPRNPADVICFNEGGALYPPEHGYSGGSAGWPVLQ